MKKQVAPVSVFGLFLIALTIPFGVKLVEKGYRFPRAAEEESPIAFAPSGGSQRVGEPFTVRVNLNTNDRVVDALDLLIQGINLEVTAQRVSLPQNLSYRFGPENILNRVYTSILANSETGYRNNTNQAILELSVKGLAYCAESRLVFDPAFSTVASQGENIVGEPVDAVFNIETPPGAANPSLTSPIKVDAQLNQVFSYTATATNPNNASLTYHYSNLPDWLVAAGPTISGTPDQTGVYQVGMIVTDDRGGSACATLTITVLDQTEITISQVRVSPLLFDSATINWKTNRPATSTVEYGTTTSYGLVSESTTLTQDHRITLLGLSPSTKYYFRIRSNAQGAPNEALSDGTFTTPPFPKEERILKLNLKMEGKRPNDNDHTVRVKRRDGGWSKTFVPHGDGYYPLSLKGFPITDARGTVDLLLKGYQHLQVRRRVFFPPGTNEVSVDYGVLPAGDIGPKGKPDNFINTIDYSVLVGEISAEERPLNSIADLNSDGAVNSIDYSLMVNNFNRDGDS